MIGSICQILSRWINQIIMFGISRLIPNSFNFHSCAIDSRVFFCLQEFQSVLWKIAPYIELVPMFLLNLFVIFTIILLSWKTGSSRPSFIFMANLALADSSVFVSLLVLGCHFKPVCCQLGAANPLWKALHPRSRSTFLLSLLLFGQPYFAHSG